MDFPLTSADGAAGERAVSGSSAARNIESSRRQNPFYEPERDTDRSIHSASQVERATSHYPVTVSLRKLRALVFSGGGVHGVLHIAVIRYLQDQGILCSQGPMLSGTGIETLVGASAGSLITFIIALGCTTEEMYEFLHLFMPLYEKTDVSFHRLFDAIHRRDETTFCMVDAVRVHRMLYKFAARLLPGWVQFCRETPWEESDTYMPCTPAHRIPRYNCYCEQVSVSPDDPAHRHETQQQLHGGCCTFALFHKLTNVDLRIVVTDAHRASPIECSVESTPDVCVFQALMASMSIPFLLPPVFIVSKAWDGTYRQCRDGGISCNYPMWFAARTYNAESIIGSFIGGLQKSYLASRDTDKHAVYAHQDQDQAQGQDQDQPGHPNACAFPFNVRLPSPFSTSIMGSCRLLPVLSGNPSLRAFLQAMLRTIVSMAQAVFQFSSWKLIPDAWKLRTLFPPQSQSSRIHTLSLSILPEEAIRQITLSAEQLHQQNAIEILPKRAPRHVYATEPEPEPEPEPDTAEK